MLEKNRCEHPIGGWFGECEKTDKNGKVSVGIGKAIADVKVYSLHDPTKTVFEYAMCKDCLAGEMIEGLDAEHRREELTKSWNGEPVVYQIVEVKYRDGKTEPLYPLRKIILTD